MRVGILVRKDVGRLEWAAKNKFGSIAWIGFDQSDCAPPHAEWKKPAEAFAAEAARRNLRLSAIGASYGNPLDPEKTECHRAAFLRAIDVAAHLGVRTVAGFFGAVIELEKARWGGHTVYKPFEDFMPRFRAFWEPIAKIAKDKGVRLAFEHCATGAFHLPVMNFNFMGRPAMWERVFNEIPCDNLGVEWDASHLVCQFIDPVANIHKFGSRIFHVHAKGAYVNRPLLAEFGICHSGVIEHRMPGFGEENWSEIVHALFRAGYDSDLNIEGWHDPVFRDHADEPPADVKAAGRSRQAGQKLEEAGLLIARKHLERFIEGTEPAAS
ncbi:MAG: sugar phosphate isomerase/epimerase [Verrucomicrobiae bacterium]|nr:sugar phosphate isomerase/epimerase [Verrucomicrobiae bacterium]